MSLGAITADINVALVSEYEGVFSTKSQLLNPGLFLEVRGEVIFELDCEVKCYFFGSRRIFLGPCSQLPEVTLSESVELLILCQYHRVVVSAGYLCRFLPLKELDELRVGQVLLIGVPELPLIFVLPTSTP